MSMEQAKLFIERMMKDEEFRTRIMAVDDVAERMKIVNAEGYDCTSEEIKTMSEDISDNSVVGIAGGGVGGCHQCRDLSVHAGCPW